MIWKIFSSQFLKNINKFIIIFFIICLSITGFIVADSIIKNIDVLVQSETKPLVGSDVSLGGSILPTVEQKDFLDSLKEQFDIVTAEKVSLNSTLVDENNDFSLSQLIFVGDEYPLYGQLTYETIDSNGFVIVDQNTFDTYGKDNSISVGEKNYKVKGIITEFPQSWFSIFTEGKRLVFPIEKLEETGLIKFGSRYSYNYMIKVNKDKDIESILEILEENKELLLNYEISDISSGSDQINQIVQEMDKYIKIVLIVSFLIASIAMFLLIEAYFIGERKNLSILRILGMKSATITALFLWLFFVILILGFGVSLFLSQLLFVFVRSFEITKDFHVFANSQYKWFLIWFIVVLISVLLPLIKFIFMKPIQGLKDNFLQVYEKKEILFQSTILSVWIFLIYISIVGGILESFLFTLIIVLAVFIWYFVVKFILDIIFFKLVKGFKKKNFNVFDAIRQTIKPGNLTIVIIIPLLISIWSVFLISILSFVFTSKLTLTKESDTNVFVINILEEDIAAISNEYPDDDFFGIFPWRIKSINEQSLEDYTEEKNWAGEFSREYFITTNELKDTPIIKWKELWKNQLSVDVWFARRLDIEIWDKIEFFIQWKLLELEIVNLREAATRWVNPFFYFQVRKEDFQTIPKSYFVAKRIEEKDFTAFENKILTLWWPHIVIFNAQEIIDRVISIVNKVFLLVNGLFAYIFIFALISLVVSITFLKKSKKYKMSIYRFLWAKKDFIEKNVLIEYIYIVSLAFLISIVIGTVIALYFVTRSSFWDWSSLAYMKAILFILIFYIVILISIKIVR